MEVAKERSATETMKMYEENVQFPARLADMDEAVPTIPQRTEQRKQISYSPDTPQDTRNRPNSLFARHVTSDDPESPHRCPDEKGWAETSFKNDWEYNIRQCRLLLCDRNPALPDVTYRRLMDDIYKDRLVMALNKWLTTIQEDWREIWENMLLRSTDIYLVWKGQHLNGNEEGFDSWDKRWSLVGSNLEAFARQIGDIEDEDEALSQAHPSSMLEPVQDEAESGNFSDQNSTASESDEDEGEVLAAPMDREEDDDLDVDVASQKGQFEPEIDKSVIG